MEYEIFISFKHTDDFGNLTPDFEIAQNLYNSLTKLGYNVFFSSQSLEEIGSSRYKSDIDSALDSAKIMIVVLSKNEYATAHWVQYEWDSFYNDYLSGVRSEANLFTLTQNTNVNELPRTLRNVQNFDVEKDGISHICAYISHIMPKIIERNNVSVDFDKPEKRISIVTGKDVTLKDITEAVYLDTLTYDDIYHVDTTLCEQWFKINPDIYVMARDNKTQKIIAYVNISPITDECYEQLKNGDFIDTGITPDMILSYDMPFPYNLYFSSIVIHPDYLNSEVFLELFNAIIEKFLSLGKREVYIKRMIADAVTKNGEKFCKLFGMTKIKGSDHDSNLYEVVLIPPKFRVFSTKVKELYDYYQKEYEKHPFLFDDEL